MRSPASGLFFLPVLAPYLYLVHRFWHVDDDAFITFRYARNLALGHGPRYNLGDAAPVEGYSNFLWVLITSVFELLGLDVPFWANVTSTACGAVLLWLVYDALQTSLGVGRGAALLATLSLACFPPFGNWASGGLETMLFALLVFVAFDRWILRPGAPDAVGGGIAALALALVRVEGVGWAIVIIVLAAVTWSMRGRVTLRPFLLGGGILLAGFATLLVFRLTYYGTPIPNTVHAKAVSGAPYLERGSKYLVSYFLTFLTPLVVVPGAWLALRPDRREIGLPSALLVLGFYAYSVLVSGDFMPMWRFLVPTLPFQAMLFGWVLQSARDRSGHPRLALGLIAVPVLVVGLLPGWDVHVVPGALRESVQFRYGHDEFLSEFRLWQKRKRTVETLIDKGRALRAYTEARLRPGVVPSYIAPAIGAVGYYSDLYLYDIHGLVNVEVARREIDPAEPLRMPGHDRKTTRLYFVKDEPTIVTASSLFADDPGLLREACGRAMGEIQALEGRWGLSEKYVADFAPVDVGEPDFPVKYVVTIVRIDALRSSANARADLERRLAALPGP